MELSLLQMLATLGPGFVIAGIVMLWKRADDARYAAELKRLVERQQQIEEKSQLITTELTKALLVIQSSVENLADLSRIEAQLQSLYDAQAKTQR